MNRVANVIKSAFLCLAVLSLPSCSSVHVGDYIPHAIGGLPADTPPRRGTPEYDAWMAERAEEAAKPKTEQQQPKKAGSPLLVQTRLLEHRLDRLPERWAFPALMLSG
jgi:hypothetical protein